VEREVGVMTTLTVDKRIDTRFMLLPVPLMSVIVAIRAGEVGDVIEVLSADHRSTTDIPVWLRQAGHELVETADEDGYTRFVVRKTG
jgi:tRNA 2-thiouridine synthesizing protein A